MIMEAMKTMESPAEKRCYTVEDLQIILGVKEAGDLGCADTLPRD